MIIVTKYLNLLEKNHMEILELKSTIYESINARDEFIMWLHMKLAIWKLGQ